MTDVILVYPYFYGETKDRSIFKFPPLGLGYLAASLIRAGYGVEILDGSFNSRDSVVDRIALAKPAVVGFYCMMTMEKAALSLAREVKKDCGAVVAGGPYPSADPDLFLDAFDYVIIGEAERTLPELVAALDSGGDKPREVDGLAFLENGRVCRTNPRDRIKELDELPFPARELFDNLGYKEYWRRNYGYTTTSMITTRGCPFSCGFCSKPVFGSVICERSAGNVVDEIERISKLGYDRIWMADDCFTLNEKRTAEICQDIISRGLKVEWECLSRVDSLQPHVLDLMRESGCARLFFGLESGDDMVLKTMRKSATFAEGRAAVELAGSHGLSSGGFFILGYPGETNETLIKTVNQSSALPLDYLSYTVPYPLPGTDLYDKVKDKLKAGAWTSPRSHSLLYKGDFSILKLKFAMAKGLTQRVLLKRGGGAGRRLEAVFRRATDAVLSILK
ncbi:MAG: radical SAM protein [Actinomycetota bacterium]